LNIPKIIKEVGTLADYGCEINAINVSELFVQYESLGFIYPAKKKRLAKLMPLIEENWNRLLKIKPSVMQIVTFRNEAKDFGTMCMLQSSNYGWLNHHGIANKLPAIALTFLTAQKVHLENPTMKSSQIWFRPNNRIMSRICSNALSQVPKIHSFQQTFNYIEFPLKKINLLSAEFRIVQYQPQHKTAFEQFLLRERGKAFLEGEDLNSDDITLQGINKLYQQVGLERYRQIWLIFDTTNNQLLGVAIAYKGPIGLNFSFLENRCELIIHSGLNGHSAKVVIALLVKAVTPQYQDFLPQFIPILADDKVAKQLVDFGGQLIRQYTQHLWTRPGFEAWYFGAVATLKNILLRTQQQLY